MFRLIVGISAPLLLCACASQLGTFYNRPVVEDDIDKIVSTVSLSADRRTIVVSHAPSTDGHPKFCAEPPPDTASALKTNWDANVAAKGTTACLKDEFESTVTVLSARNAPLDAFRTGVFTLCQFYLIGAVEKEQVEPLFKALIASYEKTQAMVPGIVKQVSAKTAMGDEKATKSE
jgi:hypothetical protein